MKGRSHQHARHAKRADLTQEDIIAAPIEVRQPDPEPALQTIVSVVYVTASPTFSGSIAGYSTVGQEDETTSSAEETHSSTKTTAAKTTATSSSASHTTTSASTLKTSASSSSELPSSLVATTSVGSSVALLAATDNVPTSTAVTSSTSASSANASSTAAADTSSSGMSAGGKAGLVVGILLLLGVGLALLLFFFKKKKQAAKAERLDDEKSAMVASSARRAEATRVEVQRQASQRSNGGGAAAATAAHRLSLRPVTQFQPFNEKTGASQAPSQMGGMLTPVSSAPSYHSQQPQDQNRNNPFGNHAESIDTPNTNGPPIIEGFNDGGEVIAASAVVAAAASSPASNSPAPAPLKPVGLARSASKAGNGLKMDFTTKPNTVLSPPSPSGSEFSTASGATQAQSVTGMAIAAAGGPPNTTVHRVQLDFVPSMDDELELKAGQLIRILHEYDDGWVSFHTNFYYGLHVLIEHRLFAFVSIVLNKVSFLELVSLLVLLNHVLNNLALKVHLLCVPNNVLCHLV